MKRAAWWCVFALWAGSASAAPLECEALKAEIEAKIQSNGVADYTLEIVDSAEAKDPAMIVGSCANGTRKIIYQKNG